MFLLPLSFLNWWNGFSMSCSFFLNWIFFFFFFLLFFFFFFFFFLFFFFFFFFFRILLILILTLKIWKIFILLILLIESSYMKSSISFGDELYLVGQRNKDIYNSLWLVFSKGGNQKILIFFFNVKGSRFFGIGSENDISDGKNFSLTLLSIFEFIGLSLSQNLSKKHFNCWYYKWRISYQLIYSFNIILIFNNST